MKILKKNKWLIIISFILFFVPFFWLKPGEMDLGGDASRLFFYDPISYLQTNILYNVQPSGVGAESISYFSIPFILALAFFKSILRSSTFLIASFNGIQLSLAFISIYFIVKDFFYEKNASNFSVQLASIFAAFFYILSPVLIYSWDRALLQHSQLFLNPLIFLLVFKFLSTKKKIFIYLILLLTVLFSFNFTYLAASAIFSFYPLAFLFLSIYFFVIKKTKIPLKEIIFASVALFLLNAFHLIPHIVSIFFSNSAAFNNVFSKEGIVDRGLGYFLAIAPDIKVSNGLMDLQQQVIFNKERLFDSSSILFIVFPALILVALIFNKQKRLLLTGLFFLITVFFYTANITSVGFNFYKSLFNIPGFAMFRNFYGQWSNIYIFFYSLLLGGALIIIFQKIKRKGYALLSFFVLLGILFVFSWQFINGTLINKVLYVSKDIKAVIKMDPEYESFLKYLNSAPSDSRVLSFPLTDFGYQMLAGENGGVYQGPTTIGYLLGRKDFSGYLTLEPFGYTFMYLISHKDYSSLENLLSLLNIRYIFYNSDPYIYDDNFPGYPYQYVKKIMPTNQKLYKEFLEQLDIEKRVDFGNKYHLYVLSEKKYLPHIYTAKKSIYLDTSDKIRIVLPFSLGEEIRYSIKNYNFASQKNDISAFLQEATAENVDLEIAKNKKEILLASSVSQDVYDLLYPLLALQKKVEEQNLFVKPLVYFDSGVFSLEKYIKEIEKKDRNLSWDIYLKGYEDKVNNLTTQINSDKNNFYSPLQNKIKLSFVLKKHELLINNYVKSSTFTSPLEKKYVEDISDKMFSSLLNNLNLSKSEPMQFQYNINLEPKGEYEVYFQNGLVGAKDEENLKLNINNDSSLQYQNSNKNWINFGKFFAGEKTDHKISLTIPDLPLFSEEEFIGLQKSSMIGETKNFIITDGLVFNYINGLIQENYTWDFNSKYFITFDYSFSNMEDAVNWNKYGAVVEPGENNQTLLKIINNNGRIKTENIVDKSNIVIKNVSIIQLETPKILFEKNNIYQKEEQAVPQISFTRINPTKYKILVKNAITPYTLVFSELFNNNWKLYISPSASEEEKTQISYFKGDVKEGSHKKIFFNENTFETWGKKPIDEINHFQVNGYANGWYIKPEDVGGKREYEFILEMSTQKIFYIGLAISIFSFLIFILIGILVIVRDTGIIGFLFKRKKV
ncbi:hypothetical protein C4559_02125 [Candidatus Microgenomates bacterium]|nr:MAG: hypothetical protein C4559_02125 [Candidatus Microgenomates bacterium]